MRRFKVGRPSPALVIALLALFVSLGGTGYAALTITGKNVRNSSLTGRDVKNRSLTGKDVKDRSLTKKDFKGSVRGRRGRAGAAGPAGAAGSAGAPGQAGLAGPQGPQGPQGPKGDKGESGATGDPGPFPEGNLPSGKTIRGVYAVSGRQGSDFQADQGISFGFRLAADPTPHYIESGATPPAQCPGSAADPQAQSGHLCVYEDFAENVSSRCVTAAAPYNCDQASREGATILVLPGALNNRFVAAGTWAVTSP